ncbi:MAG: alpha/beta fold hydrolase [Planctomycetia bacterium]|nr:alpha/beta fold hydrolase [Planctomycetia bacterium]
MKNSINLLILFISIAICSISNAQIQMNFDFDTPYGNNESVGKYANVNGIRMYYEEYGEGEPMFLIHGNGSNIKGMGNQIDYFKSKYRVIIADSRGHGKSELKTDSLTYVQIAQDWAELANHLSIDSVNIIGWSDGGIVGLLMGINHPTKVRKIAAMGANLRPDTTAVYSWVVNWVLRERQNVEAKIVENDTTRNWLLKKQHIGLMANQPNISKFDLSKIKIPVLIIAGDKDVIREEHSVEIYQSIRKAQLCIFPGETHFMPASNPDVFNKIVEEFIVKPFSRPDSDWTKW